MTANQYNELPQKDAWIPPCLLTAPVQQWRHLAFPRRAHLLTWRGVQCSHHPRTFLGKYRAVSRKGKRLITSSRHTLPIIARPNSAANSFDVQSSVMTRADDGPCSSVQSCKAVGFHSPPFASHSFWLVIVASARSNPNESATAARCKVTTFIMHRQR